VAEQSVASEAADVGKNRTGGSARAARKSGAGGEAARLNVAVRQL